MYTSSNHFSHQTNKIHSGEPRNVRLFPGVRIRTVGCHCVSRVCQAIWRTRRTYIRLPSRTIPLPSLLSSLMAKNEWQKFPPKLQI
jgi:hypothetical protein